ncbi:sigma 54-interacting transcriptional regulator [Clostridium sp. WLY-B-L2]|uniref:HTH-type transcriptional regulatory protein TyrR n=1 Tax=Clostridium aromativorans TaxID=2836848 RepID=A0ABS8N745_9CLOT|nr:sigma 54-interacting transcriptional regulator [Clostridium aromativorans]MCC9295618.1 sigma 54-interacting transcriptional regulator [Clostridium aromativorans]
MEDDTQIGKISKCDFEEIVDNLYDGIYFADGEGNTLYVNRAYTEMTGLNRDKLIGRNVKDLLKEGVYYNAVTLEVIKQKKTVTSIGKAKKGVEMLITGSPIFSHGGTVRRVVVIDRDISELRRIQRELELSLKKIKVVEKINSKKEQEIEHLRKQQLNNNFIGSSKEMKEILKMISKVAPLDVTVLITGESGVGKEVVANQIFRKSLRNKGAFIKVNCAAIPANLLESELFGYEKGAFTGAINRKIGLFELSDKGTLMLDEIGDMSLNLQAKLLRVIQEKEITRIGGEKTIPVDVRIIAVTNKNLKKMVKQGTFREDLYYRINVFPIHILPLRSRRSDILDLLDHFLKIYNTKYSKEVVIDKRAISVFQRYPWPGNIRELKNIIERIVIISEPHTSITPDDVASLLMMKEERADMSQSKLGLRESIQNVERELIKEALKRGGSTRKAAEILKISQSAVVKKAKKLSIDFNKQQ